MEKSVHIFFTIEYTVVKGKERAFIRLRSLSPAINQKLKFGIVGKEEQYSFDELRRILSKSYFGRGDKLYLFIVNQQSGVKQSFGINVSVNWPENLAGDKVITAPASFEITQYLKKIGILD